VGEGMGTESSNAHPRTPHPGTPSWDAQGPPLGETYGSTTPSPPSYHTLTPGHTHSSDLSGHDAMSVAWGAEEEIRVETPERPPDLTIPTPPQMATDPPHTLRITLRQATDHPETEVGGDLRVALNALSDHTHRALDQVTNELSHLERRQVRIQYHHTYLEEKYGETETQIRVCEGKIQRLHLETQKEIRDAKNRIAEIAQAVAPVQEAQIRVGQLESRVARLAQAPPSNLTFELPGQVAQRLENAEKGQKNILEQVEGVQKSMADLRLGVERDVAQIRARMSETATEETVFRQLVAGEIEEQNVAIKEIREETRQGIQDLRNYTDSILGDASGHILGLAQGVGAVSQTQEDLFREVQDIKKEIRGSQTAILPTPLGGTPPNPNQLPPRVVTAPLAHGPHLETHPVGTPTPPQGVFAYEPREQVPQGAPPTAENLNFGPNFGPTQNRGRPTSPSARGSTWTPGTIPGHICRANIPKYGGWGSHQTPGSIMHLTPPPSHPRGSPQPKSCGPRGRRDPNRCIPTTYMGCTPLTRGSPTQWSI